MAASKLVLSTNILAYRPDRNVLTTAKPMLLGSNYPIVLVVMLADIPEVESPKWRPLNLKFDHHIEFNTSGYILTYFNQSYWIADPKNTGLAVELSCAYLSCLQPDKRVHFCSSLEPAILIIYFHPHHL
jgi:hypothetical protein